MLTKGVGNVPIILSGGAWSPTDPTPIGAASPWAYLDAENIGLGDDDVIATWADLSGNGKDHVQATTSKKPTYKLNIVNGLPVVRFDGADDSLKYAAAAAYTSDPLSVFMVYKHAGSYTGADTILSIQHTSKFEINAFSDTTLYVYFNGNLTGVTVPAMSAQFRLLSLIRDNTSLKVRVDGVSKADVAIGAGVETGSSSGIGARSQLENLSFAGDYASLIIYEANCETDLATIEGYLATRYGISLP